MHKYTSNIIRSISLTGASLLLFNVPIAQATGVYLKPSPAQQAPRAGFSITTQPRVNHYGNSYGQDFGHNRGHRFRQDQFQRGNSRRQGAGISTFSYGNRGSFPNRNSRANNPGFDRGNAHGLHGAGPNGYYQKQRHVYRDQSGRLRYFYR